MSHPGTALALYVMLWPTPAVSTDMGAVIRVIPMSRTTCMRVWRAQEKTGMWPATACMPGTWRVGEPLPWDTSFALPKLFGVCERDDPKSCA